MIIRDEVSLLEELDYSKEELMVILIQEAFELKVLDCNESEDRLIIFMKFKEHFILFMNLNSW